jgi:hypothetical protein
MNTEIPKMRPEVEPKFNCVKVLPGEVVWRNKHYDLSKIDLETANKLAEEKFPYLERKTASSVTPPEKPKQN